MSLFFTRPSPWFLATINFLTSIGFAGRLFFNRLSAFCTASILFAAIRIVVAFLDQVLELRRNRQILSHDDYPYLVENYVTADR